MRDEYEDGETGRALTVRSVYSTYLRLPFVTQLYTLFYYDSQFNAGWLNSIKTRIFDVASISGQGGYLQYDNRLMFHAA